MKKAFTFDDVLLVPKRSAVVSRKDVDLRTTLAPGITLNIPIISANMDTVTESRMAIAIARAGGLGIVHRFLSIEDQAGEVAKVKRAENYIVEQPLAVSPNLTLKAVRELSRRLEVQTFLVTDEKRRLLGILTKRDTLFAENDRIMVGELMTPRANLITGTPETTLEQAKEIFRIYKVEKLPLVDSSDYLIGLITARDIMYRMNPLAVRDPRGRLLVGAAVGVKGDYLERADALSGAGADLLVIDIAHGHLETCLEAVRRLKKKFPNLPLVAGNVATSEGSRDLVMAGADCVKVGVGPGSICKTRIVTGAGMPQLTAIFEASRGAARTTIIADGGVRQSGDITKALAAGAGAVMIGSLFAGTDESPGEIVMWNNRRSKLYRGMASLGAHLERKRSKAGADDGEILSDFVSEGADQVTIPYRGSLGEVLAQLVGGLRSGMSYCGSHTLEELRKNAEFVRVSDAGHRESGIHGGSD